MVINYFIDKHLGIDRSFLYRRIDDGPLELFSRSGEWIESINSGHKKIRNIKLQRYLNLMDKDNPYDIKVIEWSKIEFYNEVLADE